MLYADKWKTDPRVQEAKRLLQEALHEHRMALTCVQPPKTALTTSYAQAIAFCENQRSLPLVYPYLGSGFGNGPLVELADGSIKYDFISGIGVHVFGHSSDAWLEASFSATLSDVLMQGNLQQNGETNRVMELFSTLSGLPHCFLSTSGVMANENALKLAFQHKPGSTRLLAFQRCFTGRTMTCSQITDKPEFRQGLPLQLAVDYLPFYDPNTHQESIQQAVRQLKTYISRYPGAHALFIVECVQGEGGIYPGHRDFFIPLFEICKQENIAIFADEVQTFGRTHQPFAFQHFGLETYIDIAAVGKLTQLCATLFSSTYRPKAGLLSQTFTASSAALFAAEILCKQLLATPDLYGDNGRLAAIHKRFVSHLEPLKNKLHGPYGLGAMIGFTVGEGEEKMAYQFCRKLFDAGVIAFVAGSHPTRVRLLPPFLSLKDQDIDNAMQILTEVTHRVLP